MHAFFQFMLIVAVAMCGACTISNDEAGNLPVVRAGIGMDPAEVVRQSTYPLDFHAGERAFLDPALEYGGLIVTSSVDFEVLGAHRLFIEDVRYWMIGVDFDEVELISASPSFLTVDEALARAQEWVGEIESAGWQRQRFLYSMPEREPYTDWNTLREAFLLPGGKKILGATIGVWHSADNEKMLIVGVQHKAPGGGPRYETTPAPKDPLNDRTYLLKLSVSFSDELRASRAEHLMERREQAMKRKLGASRINSNRY